MDAAKTKEAARKLGDIINTTSPVAWKSVDAASLDHLKFMTEEIQKFCDAGRLDKAFKWLGYVQGVLVAFGAITLEEAKGMNKPTENPQEIPAARRMLRGIESSISAMLKKFTGETGLNVVDLEVSCAEHVSLADRACPSPTVYSVKATCPLT